MSSVPAVSLALSVACVAAFAAQVARGGLTDLNRLRELGAMDPALVERGEIWRLLSAAFLHGSLDHLLGNLVMLYVLGLGCEHAFGRSQFLALYVASGVCGSLLSLTGGRVSVGALGAIFGLAGALVATLWKHRARLHVRDRRIGLLLVAWAGYQLLIGAMLPQVDNRAHLGGLLCGAVRRADSAARRPRRPGRGELALDHHGGPRPFRFGAGGDGGVLRAEVAGLTPARRSRLKESRGFRPGRLPGSSGTRPGLARARTPGAPGLSGSIGPRRRPSSAADRPRGILVT